MNIKKEVPCNFKGTLTPFKVECLCEILKRIVPDVRMSKGDGRIVNGKIEVAVNSLQIKGGDIVVLKTEDYMCSESTIDEICAFLSSGCKRSDYDRLKNAFPPIGNKCYI